MSLKFQKISINIPDKLMKKFDEACKTRSYSRPEAIKECMRYFIAKKGDLNFLRERLT